VRTIPLDFPWRPGMRILPSPSSGDRYARVLAVADGIPTIVAVEMRIQLDSRVGPWIEAWSDDAYEVGDMPDEDDPATIGALAGAVRGACSQPRLRAAPSKDGWRICRPPTPQAAGLEGMLDKIIGEGPTEFHAWLAAWNARPG